MDNQDMDYMARLELTVATRPGNLWAETNPEVGYPHPAASPEAQESAED